MFCNSATSRNVMIAVTVLITSCQVSTLGTTDSVGTHNTTTSTQIVKNQPLETHSLVCVANLSKLVSISSTE